MSRARQIAKGALALGLLLGLLGGVPYLLVAYVGWPLPHGVPTWSQFTTALGTRGIPDETLLKALALAVWIAWASLTAAVLAEVVAVVRGTTAMRLPLAGVLQPLAGQLLAAVLVGALALARPLPSPSLSLPSTSASLGGAQVAAVLVAEVTRSSPSTNGAAPPTAPATVTYVVLPDDTLWGIAAARLGDGERWEEIFELNRGRPQADGRSLTNPHWIYPGWVLVLPTSAHPAHPESARPEPVEYHASPPVRVPTTRIPAAPVPSPIRPTGPVANGEASRTTHGSAHVGPSGDDPQSVDQMPQRLPSGSLIGGSFALGILSALALARRRRRHAYRYRPPVPGRRLDPEPLGPALSALVGGMAATNDASDAVPVVVPAAPADADLDHRERPDFVEIGMRDNSVVSGLVTELTGVCFVGRGADSVVRNLICSLLARSGPVAAEVVGSPSTFERLFPGTVERAASGDIPGVRIVPSDETICALLEAHMESRTRQFALEDVADVLAYRQTCPWDPMPSVIALVDQVETPLAERWEMLLANGARLGFGMIVLNPAENARRSVDLGVDDIATVVGEVSWSALVDGVRCFSLEPSEAIEILTTLAAAEERPSSEEPSIGHAPPLLPDDSIDAILESEAPTEPWPEAPEVEAPSTEVTPPITVRVFGPYEIAVNGRVIDKGLRSVARELFAWYLLRPEGASRGAVVEACWPNTEPAALSNTFWRPVGDLRRLVGAAAEPPTKLLDSSGGDVYRLDAAAIDCDLWRFQAALAVAARARSDEDARRALREAVDCYRGEFLDGVDYFWVEPVREDLHRRALDAHLRLAELEDALGNPDGATAALERATEFDRYAEEPYRRLMALQGGRGRLDAVNSTWRLLERRLAEIDIDPEDVTIRLYRSITAYVPSGGRPQRMRLPS